MSRADSPGLRGTWLGALLRLWNPVMRRLLGSRLHWPLSRWFLLLAWAGPRTGRVHTIPLSYVPDDSRLYVTTGDRWWRTVRDVRDVRVRLAGRWRSARADAVEDREESTREHDRLFRRHPFFRRLAGIPGDGGRPDQAALARAIASGRTLIVIELVT